MSSRLSVIAALILLAATLLVAATPDKADRLAGLLAIEPGMTVAEIGAGDGNLTVLIARKLGGAGHM